MEKTAKQFLEQEGYKSYVGINGDDLFENLETLLNKYDQFRVSQQLTKERAIKILRDFFQPGKYDIEKTAEAICQLSCPDAQKEIEELKSALTSKESDVKKAVDVLDVAQAEIKSCYKKLGYSWSNVVQQIDETLLDLKSESNQSKS